MRGYDQYIVKVDGSRRLTRRNRKYLRKFEPYKPDGMNAPQTQTLQEGLPGTKPRVAVREKPLIQLDPIPARVGETPRPAPQSTHQPRSTAPVATETLRTL